MYLCLYTQNQHVFNNYLQQSTNRYEFILAQVNVFVTRVIVLLVLNPEGYCFDDSVPLILLSERFILQDSTKIYISIISICVLWSNQQNKHLIITNSVINIAFYIQSCTKIAVILFFVIYTEETRSSLLWHHCVSITRPTFPAPFEAFDMCRNKISFSFSFKFALIYGVLLCRLEVEPRAVVPTLKSVKKVLPLLLNQSRLVNRFRVSRYLRNSAQKENLDKIWFGL